MSAPRTVGGDAGLTLVEILVVVAILGLMATAISTDWQRSSRSRRLLDIGGTMRAFIDAARVEALRSGRDLSVEVDPAGGRLEVPAIGRRLRLPKELTMIARLAELGDRSEIVMLADGSSTGGEIEFALPGGPSMTLEVSWATGTPSLIWPGS
jgi:general secretion pathway protein H